MIKLLHDFLGDGCVPLLLLLLTLLTCIGRVLMTCGRACVALLVGRIFNTNGRNWKQQRQTASHLFKVRELRHMAEVFLSHGRQVPLRLRLPDVLAVLCW
jgi:hypothetical protein